MPSHPSESPAKKQSKWSPEEDSIIIDLRGSGMKWEDISKRLPGRSAISCRLHYQNYLERRSEWDEERKNKLARLYERFKPEMWAKVAEELAVPWRAAEAMHWQLGEADMARRAGVVPFSLSGVNAESTSGHQRPSNPPSRGQAHSHSHSHSSAPPYAVPGYESGPHAPIQRTVHTRSAGPTRSIAARRETTPRSVPPPAPVDNLTLAGIRPPMELSHGGNGSGRGGASGGQMLPSVSEMTTRPTPYSTPGAYSVTSTIGTNYPSPGPILPALGHREGTRSLPAVPEGQRSHTPEAGREGLRRRQYE